MLFDDASPAGTMSRNRVVEWVCALIIVCYALTVLAQPDTIARGNFRYLLALGITPSIFFWSCLIVGTVRILALAFNGRGLPWTARVRALSAMFGGVVFGHLAFMLAYTMKDGNPLPLGFWTHGWLVAAEIYTCLRAGADVNEVSRSSADRDTVARMVASDSSTGDVSIVDSIGKRPASGDARN